MGYKIYFNYFEFDIFNILDDDLLYFGGEILIRLQEIEDMYDFFEFDDETIDWIEHHWDHRFHKRSYFIEDIPIEADIWDYALVIRKCYLDEIESKLVKLADKNCIELPDLTETDFDKFHKQVDTIYHKNFDCNEEKNKANKLQAFGCYLYYFVRDNRDDTVEIIFDH